MIPYAKFYDKVKNSLVTKISVFTLICTNLIFATCLAYTFWYSSKLVLRNIEAEARALNAMAVDQTESVMYGIEKLLMFTASYLEDQDYTKEDLLIILEDLVSDNDEIYGAAIAFEPYAFDPNKQFFSPYYFNENGAGNLIYLSEDAPDYNLSDWYTKPETENRLVWSEPYFDLGAGNITMITCSAPFYKIIDGRRNFAGVITADVSLEWLAGIVSSGSVLQSGYSFLISGKGNFVSHPDETLIMKESIFSIAKKLQDQGLEVTGRNMVNGDEGFVPYQSMYLDRPGWIYYSPLRRTGWSMGVVSPQDELFADVYALSRNLILMGVIGFVILIALNFTIINQMIKPLRALAAATTDIARGKLDTELPRVTAHDEVGDLSRAFEKMRLSLKEYISNLAETIKAQEHLDSELKIAQNIQMNFLPKRFPAFPGREEFELYAKLEPARYVGGDFYDFFLLDDNELFISIGDVADKGIPSALFMAMTKTLMKGIAEQVKDPAELLMKVNNEIAAENVSCMFVTVFCGILYLDTGEFVYSNAGHNAPVLIRNQQLPEWLEIPEGFILGPLENTVYKNERIHLNSGDLLFLCTDGVNEAMDSNRNLFSDDGLIDTITGRNSDSVYDLVHLVMDSVNTHAGEHTQSDDITTLALHYHGRSGVVKPV